MPCDVEDIASVDALFAAIREKWGTLDFVVHAIGFSDKNELKGLYADTTRENFSRTMVISCFSFTEIAKRAAELMTNGGSMLTLTYNGSQRVIPNYNVMGVAKAALEASVRYLAADYGPRDIRVNAISAGRSAHWRAPAFPMRAQFMRGTRKTHRCGGQRISTISADRLFICCPTCRAALPASATTWIAATISPPHPPLRFSQKRTRNKLSFFQ